MGGGGGVNKQVNELRGGDMEFLINCNISFLLWSRIMFWFGFHQRPYDHLCILNLRRQWTYSSPLKTVQEGTRYLEKSTSNGAVHGTVAAELVNSITLRIQDTCQR